MEPLNSLSAFADSADDLLLYHYAIGWDEALEVAKKVVCRVALKYHNVTPPSFFHDISADYERVCAAGISQLREWTGLHPWRCVGDSQYNVDGLIAAGADAAICRVCPPYSPIDELDLVDADLSFFDMLDDGLNNILCVGRLAPNKNHAAAIRAFAEYNAVFCHDSRLVIVGSDDVRLKPYISGLHELCRSLGVADRVLFTGKVSESCLKAAYMSACVLLSTSMHEGFCVPAVEAMSMSIPVVAIGAGAIAETVGDAGLVWDTGEPDVLAASIKRLVCDKQLSEELGQRGRRRFASAFSAAVVDTVFSRIIGEVP